MTAIRARWGRHSKISGLDCVGCGPTPTPVYPVTISIGENKGTLLLCEACKEDVRITIGGRIWKVDWRDS